MNRSSKPAFDGFPPDAFLFLSQLAENNNKEWFEANRARYDNAVVRPALEFAEALRIALRPVAPDLKSEPRVGGSLFRIHRDTRFSTDKRPYKTQVGIRLRHRELAVSSRCEGPVFYVELNRNRLLLGVGVAQFDPQTLAVYRETVANPRQAAALRSSLDLANAQGHEICGAVLKKLPPQYAHRDGNDLLKRKGLFVSLESTLPDAIRSARFVDHCVRRFAPYAPLFARLARIARAAHA